VYRSPNSPLKAIHSLENLLKSVNKNSVMIGDFNLPDVDWMEGSSSAKHRSLRETAQADCRLSDTHKKVTV
jgi:hypothetical protein